MKQSGRRVTLLELIRAAQDTCQSDAEVVALITHMVNTGRVILPSAVAAAATPRA